MADDAIDKERLRRWRLVLGEPADEPLEAELGQSDGRMDTALAALYEGDRDGTLAKSSPKVARWLGDIRDYFPASVVRVLQQDAIDRLGLSQLLLEPELLEAVEPDVHLVSTLVSLGRVLPARSRETAREVVRKVVQEVEQRLREKLVQRVRGAISRSTRTQRPRPADLDWHGTIRKNLARWDQTARRLIADKLVGHGRKQGSLRDVILCVDQSGSMAASVVYAGIFGAVLASIPALSTRFVVFDTAVVDLTDELQDPVELLFGTQLGGGTDIARALTYCAQLVERPARTTLVLVSDLSENGDAAAMVRRAAALVKSGVTVVCLLALNDQGAPSYSDKNAEALAALGIASFACTPDQFPDLIAAALQGQNLGTWAGREGIVAARPPANG